MSQKRNVNYDLMRVIAMLFVIAIHVQGNNFISQGWLGNTIGIFISACNSVFFMISGRFNLNHRFETKEDYKNFYFKRFCTIFLPFFLFCFLSAFRECFSNHQMAKFFPVFYREFIFSNAKGHLWFMYELIGLILSTPLLSKALNAMKDWELNIVFGILMVWHVFLSYLSMDIHMSLQFAYSGWILTGWSVYFFLGYYLHRVVKDTDLKKWYGSGLLGFLVTVAAFTIMPDHFQLAASYQPCFILYSIGFYLFFERTVHVHGEKFKKIIEWIARYSFDVYLVHVKVITHLIQRGVRVSGYGLKYIGMVLLVALISIGVGFIFEHVIVKPVQWLCGYGRKTA